jgi:enamine deaminase RidA (YjgF/YER057c/UK114 family)
MDTQALENRLAELGYTLPVLPTSKGIYKRCMIVGNMLYLSGHISVNNDGTAITGKLGADLTDEEGIYAARQCGLAMLSSIKEVIGGFDSIVRVVKLLGMVNCTTDYTKHPIIINGCSELFRDVWGEDLGVGCRSAVGMGSLPSNVAVEIEAIFEVQ